MGQTTSKGIDFWQRHVEQYFSGELSVREYCQRHGLKASTFGRWRRQLRHADAVVNASTPAVNFVRVDIGAQSLGNAPLEVVLGNGRCIRVPADFDAATLTRLIATVEGLS